jgi:hypothetical protein
MRIQAPIRIPTRMFVGTKNKKLTKLKLGYSSYCKLTKEKMKKKTHTQKDETKEDGRTQAQHIFPPKNPSSCSNYLGNKR